MNKAPLYMLATRWDAREFLLAVCAIIVFLVAGVSLVLSEDDWANKGSGIVLVLLTIVLGPLWISKIRNNIRQRQTDSATIGDQLTCPYCNLAFIKSEDPTQGQNCPRCGAMF
jgi:hypothetical protein